ncbi:hypothetical protein WN943_010845 [Citrus x changshan-huyou]
MVSEAAFIRGSQVLGIIPRVLKPLGSSSDSSTGEELVVSGMQERITEMLNHADAFIFLLGDLATLGTYHASILGPSAHPPKIHRFVKCQ